MAKSLIELLMKRRILLLPLLSISLTSAFSTQFGTDINGVAFIRDFIIVFILFSLFESIIYPGVAYLIFIIFGGVGVAGLIVHFTSEYEVFNSATKAVFASISPAWFVASACFGFLFYYEEDPPMRTSEKSQPGFMSVAEATQRYRSSVNTFPKYSPEELEIRGRGVPKLNSTPAKPRPH